MIRSSLVFLVALASPVGVLYLVHRLMRWLPGNTLPRPLAILLRPVTRYATARRPPPEPMPVVLLELELRRIAEQLAAVEASDQPHKAARVAAWRGAYDLVLADLARGIGEDPPHPPLSAAQRADLELTLVGSGHLW